jgi:hypothetical protein
VSHSRYKFVVVYILYAACLQISISILCDRDLIQMKRAKCHVRWCSIHDMHERNCLHLVRSAVLINITVFLYVMPCSPVYQHQCFTETIASINAKDEGCRLICTGASLSHYTAPQPKRHKSYLIFFFSLKSLRSQTTAFTNNNHMVTLYHLEWLYVTVACEQVHDLNGNPPPIVHTTVCAVSNTTH